MCGIAGIYTPDPRLPIEPRVLDAMTDSLPHRGPDGRGVHVAPGIGLGHRRLSIIDLSAGAQPLCNEDGSVWVVFNGEIYNFPELRGQLEARGHRFRTRTDTEVIVHGYEEWGDRAVERFRGMFVFALWDARRARLLIARDRLGIKPLYYAALPGGGLAFGSEIKAVVEHPDVSREWRVDALDAYLALQYVPTPMTIFAGVHKLSPGHLLTVEDGRLRTERYWDLPFPGDGDALREEEYLGRLDELIHEAVRIRLISDVPLGAFLSGGIDSTAVVAAMVGASNGRVVTTSVGFREDAYSEVAQANEVAHHLGCEHHEKMVTPDIADLLPRLAWHLDEPFADSSAVPTYYVSAAAREHVTVALSGDGGDELWAGYARHRMERIEAQARRWLGAAGSKAVSRVAHWLPLRLRGARSLRSIGLPADQACAQKHAYGLFEQGLRDRLYSAGFAEEVRDSDPLAAFRDIYASCQSPDPLDRALYLDVRTYLLDDILTKVDRMSMAVSLEARVPLLDHKLVEFAATVPMALKFQNGRGKYLLRRFLDGRVPRGVLERPKHGFEAPIADWLRGPLAPMTGDLLLGSRFRSRGIFSQATVTRMWNEHQSGARDHRHRLWSLLMLELWFRQFVDGSAAAAQAISA
jgi:asparagine synthase (glutamine-hydrolysing)